ncbi:cell death activator CIDE-3 [Brienomyrus brachyistius]|uniref:cell death activator CIDE-3 n=1 Tax=Brienomyrus brachyistius TaxID=42636 RepID=UPI0020B1B4E0|nr:cell death activator CIDE-3 [Brienomyrus brachyistius]XP_048878829.1 cell death activator CIDE-3 [Brienomyrus brachyistius]
MMEYAKRSLGLLSPTSLSKCVTASVNASASMTQQLFTGLNSRPRPFRVSNADRSVKKGIMADSLRDLLDKAADALQVSCTSSLVLDEDGTGVDTEEFFITLEDNAVLMILEKGQKWTPPLHGPQRAPSSDRHPRHRKDVAKLTFDLYKTNPQEFIGCLNVKATLYGMYSISYDLRCYSAKRMLKEVLRWTLFSMQATGHVLLGTSCYMQQLLDEEEKAEATAVLPSLRNGMRAIQWGRTQC